MQLVTWDGGLQIQEIDALDRMQKAFVPKPSEASEQISTKSMSNFADLGKAFDRRSIDGMFPWKGYAGFRFVDSKGVEGEFDLVLVTHDRVLIVELKDLKGNKITLNRDKWSCDGYEKYRSPVSVTRPKVYLLKSKLNKIKHKFSSQRTPWVDFIVVLSNNNDYSSLPAEEKKHVMGINEFIELADESIFKKRFPPKSGAVPLNIDLDIFDALISSGNVKPKHISVQNYITTIDDQIFPLPGQDSIYTEYVATSESNKNDKALLRQWDFNKLEDAESRTPEGRYKVVSHERDVLVEIKSQAPDLYRYCLLPKTNPTSEEVTRQFHELYDLPADHNRFNEYINLYVEGYEFQDRVTLVQVLLNQFAELHQINIAHRDVGDHSLWLSPSKKISLSSFISAYHQPIGTVGPRIKKLSVGVVPLPEDIDNSTTDKMGTPFHRDVYVLGIIAQLILSGMRVTLNNIALALEEINSSSEWYGGIFKKAVDVSPSKRYANACEFRDALASMKPSTESYVLHCDEQLDIYRKKLNPYKFYPVDEELFDGEAKEAYISDNLVIRLWSDVNPAVDQPKLFQSCLDFLAKAKKLSSIDVLYLAKIEDYGLALKTSQLFLVQEKVEGFTLGEWLNVESSSEHKKSIIEQLVRGVEYLHNIEISHGDLHPGNIIISEEEGEYSLRFIDYLDFSRAGDKTRNHRYSPSNIDHATDRECDIYAVLRISSEILGIDWNNLDKSKDQFQEIVTAYQSELSGAGSLLSLDRFKEAFQNQFSDSTNTDAIGIVLRSDRGSPVSILPDNEELFLCVEKSKEFGEVKIRISGVGGNIIFFYKPETNTTLGNTLFKESETANNWERNNSQLVVNARLEISFNGSYSNYDALDGYLSNVEGLDSICKNILLPEKEDKEKSSPIVVSKIPIDERGKPKRSKLTLDKKIDTQPEDSPNVTIKDAGKLWPKSREIWRAMIDTEIDALPSITVSADPEFDIKSSSLRLEYSSPDNFLDRYSVSDEVELIRRVDDKEYFCGRLDMKASNQKYLILSSVSPKSRFKVDETLYLRTTSERSSYTRRKKAVNRVLDNTSVITNLVDYFGQCDANKILKLSRPPSKDDFSVYDRDDGHGGIISLNNQQRSAFSKLICNGPVSLLQGPPGTGKTEFIAAFTHYLITKENANHILLVSQSHEAVNTAAERIRQHCKKHETELDVVRFSNKSTNISTALIDAYSVYLVEERLEEFRAQYAERILSLQPALNLPKDYVHAVIDKELTISKRLNALRQLSVDIAELSEGSPDRDRLIKTVSVIASHLKATCFDVYDLEVDVNKPSEIALHVNNAIAAKFGIAPNESKRMDLLITLVNDYMERLDTNPGSFEEFLARSRTLVCGTCVGIGLGHLAINENQYDWVIIDEAARSVSSELAIAMQSGKRVLLVGDHKQLPPTYQEEHKTELSRRLKIDRNSPDFDWILKSDFERAFESEYGKAAGAKLLIQYRMDEPIGNMVSDVFYNSELKTGARYIPEIYGNLKGALSSTVSWLDTSPLGNRGKSQKDSGHSSSNAGEVNQIISLLKEIQADDEFVGNLTDIADGEPAIGIICMYAAQKRLLIRKFNELAWNDTFQRLVKIDTVDSYQGKENRIIIVSTTLNTDDKNPRFLRVLNRINVAMSRAMDRLVIVGSTDMWKGANSDYPLGKIAAYIQKHQGDDYQFVKPTNTNGGRNYVQ